MCLGWDESDGQEEGESEEKSVTRYNQQQATHLNCIQPIGVSNGITEDNLMDLLLNPSPSRSSCPVGHQSSMNRWDTFESDDEHKSDGLI